MITLSDLKNDITSAMHGTSLRVCTDINNTIKNAALRMLLRVDPKSTIRSEPITNAVYDKIYNYICPEDLKKIIDLQPQAVERPFWEDLTLRYTQQFDMRKNNRNNMAQVMYANTGKYLRIAKDVGKFNGVLDVGQQVTSSIGTWTTGGSATGLIDNTLNYVQGFSGIQFDLDGSSTQGYIEITFNNTVDLETIENFGSLFMWTFLPDASAITSLVIDFGQSQTDKWSKTMTSQQAQLEFRDGWNLTRADWNAVTTTGSPDASAISYLRVSVNYDSTPQTALVYNGISAKFGKNYDLVYYSEYLFRSATTGTWKMSPDDDTDIINVDPLAYQILLNECCVSVAQEAKGRNMASDVAYFKGLLFGSNAIPKERQGSTIGLYDAYEAQYPSEAISGETETYDYWDFFNTI